MLLGKAHAPQELGIHPLKKFVSFDQSFLMPFLCHFLDWLCEVQFLELATSALEPAAPEPANIRRGKARNSFNIYFSAGLLLMNSCIFCLSKKSLFCLPFERYFYWVKLSRMTVFFFFPFFCALKMFLLSLLACIIFNK